MNYENVPLIKFLRASFNCYWMTTSEPIRVRQVYYPMFEEFTKKDGSKYNVAEWDITKSPKPEEPLLELNDAPPNSVMFLYNYHNYIAMPKVVQIIHNSIPQWGHENKAIVVVSALQKIPPELEKDFTLIDFPLPDRAEIIKAMEHACVDPEHMPKGEKLEDIVTSSKSLTFRELTNIYSLSLVEKGYIDRIIVNDYRAQTIKKSGFAEVMIPDRTFDDVIGYEPGKAQVMETINNPRAKGVIWIGPPGTGKSSLGKAIAAESKKLSLKVHTGKFLSKYQGESDRLLDEFFKMIYALGECYILLDEFDKQFSHGDGEHDGGTGKRQVGRWLEFFQDRPPGVYINATCNSFVGVPSALFRIGRWDSAPWYVGMPNAKVRNKILDYYIKKEGLTKEQTAKKPDTTNWVGGEIEALCHNANMRNLTLMQASQFIKPMYATRKEEIQELERWAKGRTIPADDIPEVSVSAKRKLDL